MLKIKANAVFEILGRPKEHIREALNELILKLGSEKGIKVLEKNIRDPIEVKDTKDLYTTFAEVSLELDSIGNLLGIALAYMPAHIEVVEPEDITLSNYQLNELSNSLINRMHNYDAIVKKALMDRDILQAKLKEVAPNLFKQKQTVENNLKSSKGKNSKKVKNKKKK